MKLLKVFTVLLLLFEIHSALALNPSRSYKYMPDKYGMAYKEEKVKTKDGATLNAWIFELPNKTNNWMIISGSGDGNMGDNIEIASQFLSAGWNVAMYDYRGYGSSSDFKIDTDVYIYPQFVFDLNGVLDYLRNTRSITRFDLYGVNIGAGLSIGIGANRVETRKIIADGPWTSLEQMKKKIKDKTGKDVIVPFGYDKNLEPIFAFDKAMPHLKGVLAIVSPHDPLITPMDIKMIRGITETYIVTNSPDNASNFTTDKNTYFEKVNGFLNRQ